MCARSDERVAQRGLPIARESAAVLAEVQTIVHVSARQPWGGTACSTRVCLSHAAALSCVTAGSSSMFVVARLLDM
eukprot:7647145-Pyramimonas_sp.AAC.1